MAAFLIIHRQKDSPTRSKPGSLEETACIIAKELMDFPGPADSLMALPIEGPGATLVRINGTALCSVDVDKNSQRVWSQQVTAIQQSLENFQYIKSEAEDNLLSALADLQDKFSESREFSSINPQDEIMIHTPLEDIGDENLDFLFRETLRERFHFKVMQGLSVR
jgi:hypothetical protein